MKIIFKVGPHDARRTGAKGGFTSTNNPATAAEAISEKTLQTVIEKAQERISKDGFLDKKIAIIQNDIQKDIEKYAKQTVNFFFNQHSSIGPITVKREGREYTKSNPSSGQPLRIHMSVFQERSTGLNFKTGFTNYSVNDRDITLLWQPLTATTIKKKKGNTKYFVHDGILLNYMEAEFSRVLELILKPTITYTPPESLIGSKALTGKITVSLLAGKRGRTIENLPFLRAVGAGETINDLIKRTPGTNDLMRTYMNDMVSRKLNNVGKGDRSVRPMFTPILGYWVLSRFPIIVSRSFKKNIGKLK